MTQKDDIEEEISPVDLILMGCEMLGWEVALPEGDDDRALMLIGTPDEIDQSFKEDIVWDIYSPPGDGSIN